MIKLVALDLDGTIVNEDLEISARVKALLNRLAAGPDVRVVVATGRMFRSALPFAREIGVTEPIVAYQGAMIRSQETGWPMRYHAPIPLDVAGEVLEMLLAEDYHINLYMSDDLWTRPDNRHAALYAKTSGIQPQFHDDLLSRLTEPPTKMMVIDDERVDDLLVDLNRHFNGRLSYCRSRSNFCEIIDVSASKWNALEWLANGWGIRPEEIMAIGDQGNDLSMIRHAGIGVAMGNAPDEVKQFANYVTGTIEEDGVAEAIERFVLGALPLKN